MTDETPQPPPGREPTEAEVRAALEEELRRVTVDDVLLQTIVSLVNLGGRRAGLAPGTEDERDPEQLRLAIDAVRALLPLVEPRHGEGLAPVRDAVAQLQLAYAQLAQGVGPAAPGPSGGAPAGPAQPGPQPPPAAPGEDDAGAPGPAQSSGRLWVPGS
ncbi:MAG: hypothetical protein U0R70_18330 [Solirubrobacteraceae bacterium]